MNQDNPLRPSARLGNIKERIIVNRMLQTSVIGLAVFLLAFTLIPNLIAEASAKTAQAKIDWGSVFLTLDPDKAATDAAADKEAEMALPTHGDINFGTIMPTSRTENNSGTMVVKKKTIGITSSGTYYTVYVSTNDVSSNGLNMVSTVDGATVSSTSYQIPAVTGTWANPASLTAAASWGIAVPGTTIASTEKDDNDQYITPSFPVPSIIDDAIYNATDISSSAYQTYNNTRWASVPVRGSAQQIWKASTPISLVTKPKSATKKTTLSTFIMLSWLTPTSSLASTKTKSSTQLSLLPLLSTKFPQTLLPTENLVARVTKSNSSLTSPTAPLPSRRAWLLSLWFHTTTFTTALITSPQLTTTTSPLSTIAATTNVASLDFLAPPTTAISP